jgi:hypothetical protein
MQKIKFFMLFVMLQALLFADVKPEQSTTKHQAPSVLLGDAEWMLSFARRRASLSLPTSAGFFIDHLSARSISVAACLEIV